jgi:hypothetical protein
MDHRTTRALGAAALALALGACSDVPTAAPARIAGPHSPARTVSVSGATLISNAVKYRDAGGKPATGRSGSATLHAFALLGRDGVTQLDLMATSPGVPYGGIRHAQVKALDAADSVMFVRNLRDLTGPNPSPRFHALARGHRLRVQANVTGLDPHRTDVVTVTEPVKLRPDLSARLELPARVPAGLPLTIVAVVSELNGDVGAYATCLLRVDGAVVDMARSIWVDAGDAVSCAFTHGLRAGPHDVQAEVVTAMPLDWDDANNRSAVVRVEAEGTNTMGYTASVSTYERRFEDVWETTWHNPTTLQRGEDLSRVSERQVTEYAEMYGWSDQPIAGPVSIEVSQTTGGRVVHADAWTEEDLTSCASRFGAGGSFFLCSDGYGFGQTWFNYVRYAGAVTYHSEWYARAWDDVTGEELWHYHENDTSGWDDGVAGIANDYAFHVRLTSGDIVLTADSEFPLYQSGYTGTDGYCYTSTEPWDGFTLDACFSMERTELTWSGSEYRP